MRSSPGGVLAAVLLVAAGGCTSGDGAGDDSAEREPDDGFEFEGTIEVTIENPDRCDFLDTKKCLLPFPNDFFTVADATTDSGRRVKLAAEAMPVNVDGVPIDPIEWNRNDGFSPGSSILTFVPGLHLGQTGAAPVSDMGRSLDGDAPIVLLDAETGERAPYWAELDQSVSRDEDRSLIVRPAVNLAEGHRYVVALRGLRDASGTPIEPGPAFRAYRDRLETRYDPVEERRPHMEEVLTTLEDAGVERGDLYLAWDFTVASERNLSERLLHIRDDAFRKLGKDAPEFTVTEVTVNPTDEHIARQIAGTFAVPSYLTGEGQPGTQFNTGPDGLPRPSGVDITADFLCVVPRAAIGADGAATAARPAVYGHGLLGSEREVGAGNVGLMADEHNFVFCATKWIGMSEEDIGNAAGILEDLGKFVTLADRLQQGILDTLFLGRLMIHEDGFVSDEAFQGVGGDPVIDTRELFFDGNSQGGIIGGAATAVAVDWKRAVLGVPAMNFSTLLHRSTAFDTYKAILDPAYPDELDRLLGITLVQMLWDRAETNGYAAHLTDDPYPGTPEHIVLLHEAFGDHLVANVATEVEARTIGARTPQQVLADGRSPDEQPLWGIRGITRFPFSGSAIVVWDSGAPAPPGMNTPPRDGEDPHEDPRTSSAARRQKSEFLKRNGTVVDVCDARPCTAEPVPD
ncbi:MAG: hypothetical protein ACR2IR_11075 [Acidimicrobiia bacterium]